MSNKRFNIGFKAALVGLARTIKSEINFQVELAIAFLVIIVGLILSLSFMEWAVITLTIMVVLGFELLNTAFEHLGDLQKPRLDNVVKLAKDISAGAVLIVSLGALIVGLLIFVPHLLTILL